MTALTTGQLVAAWERGKSQHDWQRALAIIAISEPETSEELLARLTLGERNAKLFALRQDTFGSLMRAFVKCPGCGEPLEFEQSIDELLAAHPLPCDHEFTIAADGFLARCRLTDSTDLAQVAEIFFADEIHEMLIDRAVASAERNNEPIPAAGLHDTLRRGIADEIARRDPLAKPTTRLGCAACAHVWDAPFDIAAFLWTEIDRQVRTTLDDVIILAKGYGWREADILEMSVPRRQFYLDALE